MNAERFAGDFPGRWWLWTLRQDTTARNRVFSGLDYLSQRWRE